MFYVEGNAAYNSSMLKQVIDIDIVCDLFFLLQIKLDKQNIVIFLLLVLFHLLPSMLSLPPSPPSSSPSSSRYACKLTHKKIPSFCP